MSKYPKGNLALILMLYTGMCSVKAQHVDLVIQNIRSAQGQIIVAVFTDNYSYKRDEPLIRNRYPKTGLSGGTMHIQFSLKPGTYGLAILDNENLDDEMTTNLIGYPKEGYGFSDYYHSGFTRPDFKVFSFNLAEGQYKQVITKIKYM